MNSCVDPHGPFGKVIDQGGIAIRIYLFEGNEIDIKTPLRQRTAWDEPVALVHAAAVKPGDRNLNRTCEIERGPYAIGG